MEKAQPSWAACPTAGVPSWGKCFSCIQPEVLISSYAHGVSPSHCASLWRAWLSALWFCFSVAASSPGWTNLDLLVSSHRGLLPQVAKPQFLRKLRELILVGKNKCWPSLKDSCPAGLLQSAPWRAQLCAHCQGPGPPAPTEHKVDEVIFLPLRRYSSKIFAKTVRVCIKVGKEQANIETLKTHSIWKKEN